MWVSTFLNFTTKHEMVKSKQGRKFSMHGEIRKISKMLVGRPEEKRT
jgi:hypothetical protein